MNQFVMAIDDSLVIRKIVEICLHRAGYEVSTFPDGIEALRWLATPEARIPALILVDIGLPRLDGYVLIRYLKSRPGFEQTVFVILSQRDGVIDRLKGRLAGAQTYLTKPVKTADLLTAIQAHLGTPIEGHANERAMAHYQRSAL